MTLLTLNDDQVRIIAGASAPVVVVDSSGRELGKLEPIQTSTVQPSAPDEDWIQAKRRLEEYRREGGKGGFTTAEVLEHLRSLKPE